MSSSPIVTIQKFPSGKPHSEQVLHAFMGAARRHGTSQEEVVRISLEIAMGKGGCLAQNPAAVTAAKTLIKAMGGPHRPDPFEGGLPPRDIEDDTGLSALNSF